MTSNRVRLTEHKLRDIECHAMYYLIVKQRVLISGSMRGLEVRVALRDILKS